jgi:peptide methionine sulfoxide reductase MsrB|tara:strand:- start:28799 stop:29200 length:402 start_codon:yes stop_codon:yes gene_type:complete
MNRKVLFILIGCLIISCNKSKTTKSHELISNKSQDKEISKIINYENGFYLCKKCNSPLYESKNNYDSNSNDKSFDNSIENKVKFNQHYNESKTELKCMKCGTKIGNVWNDGPEPTGNRHCVSRNALIFKKLKN